MKVMSDYTAGRGIYNLYTSITDMHMSSTCWLVVQNSRDLV